MASALSPGTGHTLEGIGCVLLAGACFAALDTIAKYVTMTVPVLMALWVRYLLQALLSTLVLAPLHRRALLLTAQPGLQLLRGMLLIASTVMAFFSLKLMPVGEFTAIVMVTPLAVTVLAVFMLKERISGPRWLFVIGGFAGTLIIIRPGGQDFSWAALLPLGCVVSNSMFQLLTSYLGRSENPATTHFYSAWVGAALATLALPLTWAAVDSPWLWSLMLLMGLLGAVGHFVLALAFQRAPAATLMPYMYGHVGFAVLAGWLVFAHVPDSWAFAGIALIALCGVGAAWLTAREKRLPAQLSASRP